MDTYNLTQRDKLEDAAFYAHKRRTGEKLSDSDLSHMTDDQLHKIVNGGQTRIDPDPVESPTPSKPDASKPKPLRTIKEVIKPQTLTDAFIAQDGRLMRRIVTRFTNPAFGDSTQLRVDKIPVGARVTFDGKSYQSSHVIQFLMTGEWPGRKQRTKHERFRARVRDGAHTIHLGYFDTAAERDAAVFAYRIGLTPTK